MKPSCYNRPPFNAYVSVPTGWTDDGKREMGYIVDQGSRGCQQHGPMGEAALHPEDWDCDGCRWKPNKDETK